MGGVYSLRDLLAGGSTETVDPFRTSIPYNRESEFQDWTRANRITDLDHPDSHYDYRGAFLEGVKPEVAPDGVAHWPDTYKTPGHPTFSVESKYAAGRNDAGSWQGDQFVPPQGGGGEYSLRDLLASAGPPAPVTTAPLSPANVVERMMAPPPSYRTAEQDLTEAQRRKKVEAMTGPEAVGGFGRHALAGLAGLATIPAEVAKPILETSPEEDRNPLVQGFAAAKGGPLPAPTPVAPGAPQEPQDIGSRIARAVRVLNPVPMLETAARATWDPEALGDVTGLLLGGEVAGAFKKGLSGPQLSFSKEVMAPKDAVAARAFGSADPYEVLGLDPKTATRADVEAAVVQAAKQWHPDLHPGDARAADVMSRYGEAAQAVKRDLAAQQPVAGTADMTPEQRARAEESAPGRSAEPPPVSSRQQAGVTSPAEAAPTPATEPYKLSELLNPEAATPPERTAPPERGPVSAAAPIHENTLSTLAMARELAEAGASLKGPELEATKARIIEKYAPEKPAAVPTPPAAAVTPSEVPSAPESGQVPRATGTGEPFTSNDVGKALSILNASDNDLIVQREQLQGQLAKIPEAQRNHPTAQDLASNLDVVNHEIAGRGGLQGIQEEMGVAPQGGKPAEAGPAPAAGAVTPPETGNRQGTVVPEPPAVEPPRLGPAPTEPEKPTVATSATVPRQFEGVETANVAKEFVDMIGNLNDTKDPVQREKYFGGVRERLAELRRRGIATDKQVLDIAVEAARTYGYAPDQVNRMLDKARAFLKTKQVEPTGAAVQVEPPSLGVAPTEPQRPTVTAKMKGEPLKVWIKSRGYVEVPGAKPVPKGSLPGFEDFNFQVHRSLETGGDKAWSVTEPTTGLSTGYGRTKAAAIENALKALSTVGPEKLKEVVAQQLEKRVAREQGGAVASTGEPPAAPPEPAKEVSPEDVALDDLRGHAHAALVHEMALERGGKAGKALTEAQSEKLKHAALDERDAIQTKVEKYAETHGMAAAEALRGKLWNEVKAAAPEPAKEKDPRAKFTKMTDERLADRHVELIERFQREDARAQKGIHQWSRRDENMEGLVRSGTSFTRDAMYATGRARNASKLLNEVEAEYKARDIDDEAQRRLYEQAEERQAIINEGGEGVSVAEPDVEMPEELGESGAVNPQMVNPAKFLGSLYQKIGETEVGDAILRLFAPASRSLPAGQMAHIARANRGQAERDYIVARWALRHAADAAPLLSTPEGLEFTDAIELGQKQPNPELQPVADALRNILDDRRKKIQDLGTGALEEFNANYLGHIWDKGAQSFFKRLLSRRPLEGGKSFLKERSIPTIREGIDAGLQPMVDNPVYMQLLKIREMDKYIAAHRIWNEAKDAKLVQFFSVGKQRPDGYARIDDKIATVFAPPTAEGAMAIRGEYWAPESVARILNNMVSPGLRGNVLYDALMGAGNVLNQAQLGLSLFHAGFTTFDVIVSHLGMAIEDILNGDFKGALKTLPSVVHSPVTNPIRGWQVKMEYREPGSTNDPTLQMIVNALVEGGIRTEMPMENQTNAVERFFQNLRKNPAKLVGKTVAGGVLGGAVGGPTGAVVGAGLSSGILPAILEWATGPVMRHLVPLQKQGVAAELMRRRLERMGPNRTVEDIRTAAAEVVDTVEDRLGQVTYDNYFWHRTMKDVLHLSVRSVGWNWGFFRLVPGGLKDMSAGRFKTYSATYTMALTAMTALAGAVITYLLTGEGPKELRDYIYIKSGVKETEGNQARWVLPSYARDIGAYARHPLDTLLHKLNPLFAGLSEMWQNKDFYGDQIVNPNDPLYRRLQERAEYVGKMFVPFGVRGAIQAGEQEKPGIEQALPFIGVTPAPREAVRSPAQNAMAEYSAQHRPAMRTREEADRAKARQKLMSGLRSGKLTPGDILTKESGGEITHEESQRLIRESAENPDELRFKGLPLDVATRVYKLASPTERGVFKAVLEDKANRGDDADVKAAAEKVLESLPFVEDTSPHTGGRSRPSRPKAPPRPQRPR